MSGYNPKADPHLSGLIELPGMKGTISIHYDLTRNMVNLEAKNIDPLLILQLLLTAAIGTAGQLAAVQAGIIRPKGTTIDGSEEKKNDDKNNG